MALMLENGDYVSDGQGGLVTVQGEKELLDRILWKLSIRRGSFPLLPELGSRLALLGRAKPSQREALAGQYVAEALRDEPVRVEQVVLGGDRQTQLSVQLIWDNRRLTAQMELGGMQ